MAEDKKAEQHAALYEALTREQPVIYDYLMRMTGQVERSRDTLSEVGQVISNVPMRLSDTRRFRLQLFTTSRSFVGDIWNADTSNLLNNGFLALKDPPHPKLKDFTLLDEELRKLPGQMRETVLLFLKYKFDLPTTATIIGLTPTATENVYHQGIDRLSERTKINAMMIEELIPQLPNHHIPPSAEHHTLDLSVMIKDIRSSRLSWRGRKLWVIMAILISIFLSLGYWKYF
jgi:DNA-directed RNA polymerase specialized sigma24 family protein